MYYHDYRYDPYQQPQYPPSPAHNREPDPERLAPILTPKRSAAYPPPTSHPSPAVASPAVTTPTTEIKPILRRNQACLQCRRRKLRCDAVRPNCGTCTRSYHHAVRTNSVVNPRLECEYDEEGASAQRRPAAGQGAGPKVKRQKVAGEAEGSRSRSIEQRHELDPAFTAPTPQFQPPPPSMFPPPPVSEASSRGPPPTTEIISSTGYALPSHPFPSNTGRWYEPNGGKASQVAAAQLAEIRGLKEHVGTSFFAFSFSFSLLRPLDQRFWNPAFKRNTSQEQAEPRSTSSPRPRSTRPRFPLCRLARRKRRGGISRRVWRVMDGIGRVRVRRAVMVAVVRYTRYAWTGSYGTSRANSDVFSPLVLLRS